MSIASIIVFVVKTFWKIDIGETADGFMNVLLPVVVGFGIVNNPTDKENF